MAVHVVLMLLVVVGTSLAAVSHDRVDVATRRRNHDDDQYNWPTDSAAAADHGCQPTTNGVIPAACGVCEHLPDYTVVQCCRWCRSLKKTSLYTEEELHGEPATDADKRGKYFLGKRPKYFLGK